MPNTPSPVVTTTESSLPEKLAHEGFGLITVRRSGVRINQQLFRTQEVRRETR